MMEEEADEEVRDAVLIAADQRIEHYEIAGYRTARTYASLLGDKESAKLLQKTLDEEAETDKNLHCWPSPRLTQRPTNKYPLDPDRSIEPYWARGR
jgi:ferritin-like metal-binding protein YciE